jgi:hypothetical protein
VVVPVLYHMLSDFEMAIARKFQGKKGNKEKEALEEI